MGKFTCDKIRPYITSRKAERYFAEYPCINVWSTYHKRFGTLSVVQNSSGVVDHWVTGGGPIVEPHAYWLAHTSDGVLHVIIAWALPPNSSIDYDACAWRLYRALRSTDTASISSAVSRCYATSMRSHRRRVNVSECDVVISEALGNRPRLDLEDASRLESEYPEFDFTGDIVRLINGSALVDLLTKYCSAVGATFSAVWSVCKDLILSIFGHITPATDALRPLDDLPGFPQFTPAEVNGVKIFAPLLS